MSIAYESARLNLQLFDLRREPVLREARAWYLNEFNPQTIDEVVAVAGGARNASFQMVLGYWDMAASMVTHGAIERRAFLDAHTEIVGTFAKVEPYLEQIREVSQTPEFCAHIESVIRQNPGFEKVLESRRAQYRAAAMRRDPAVTPNPA